MSTTGLTHQTLDGEELRFIPEGRKHTCSICGRRGYLYGKPSVTDLPALWYVKCLTGHPLTCHCGRRFVNAQALSGHLTPRRPDSRPSPCAGGAS